MVKVAIQEAKNRLDELVDEVSKGETVVLAGEDGRQFQVVPFVKSHATPTFGFARGKIKMADDFDEPLEDFEEYMP